MSRRSIRNLIILFVLIAGGWALKAWLDRPDPTKMAVFGRVAVPPATKPIVAPKRAEIADFDKGGAHRLAILVTDPQSGWLGLVRGFRAQGVPITVTQDVDKALTHKVVLVYPIVSGRVLTAPQIRKVADHVRAGGTVVAFNLAGGGLDELFGVSQGREASTRQRLRWTKPVGIPDRDVLAVSSGGDEKVGSVGYTAGSAQVAATFEDGSVAAACRAAGGQACVLGVDLGALAARGMNGRASEISRSYVNAYEPTLDSLFAWVRERYVAGEPTPWLVSSAPAGKQVSILFTYDVDADTSIANSAAYADVLKAHGAKGTFFVQTKYMRDYNDAPFFNPKTAPGVRKLVDMGMEVGSHTVAHSNEFRHMKMGKGDERYPKYRPFVQTNKTVRGATILGELRVSRQLLEGQGGAKVQAFRPGYLSYPFALPQALAATGYPYSSSMTANVFMTHLPFQLTDSRANTALQPVYEFPVTIEDEKPPLMGQRVDAADKLIGQIAQDRGLVVILTHPNITGHKLAFNTAIADRWQDRAWMGSVSEFGAWWAARDAVDADVVEQGGRPVLRVNAPLGAHDLAVAFPKQGGEVRIRALKPNSRTELPLP